MSCVAQLAYEGLVRGGTSGEKSPDPLQGFTSLYVVNTVVNTQADTEGYSTGWLKKVSC